MRQIATPESTTAPGQLLREMAAINWYHCIELGNGLVTPGPDGSAKKLRTIGLPERLDGLSVLDIGTWDGYFAFEAERRGAVRVVATDSHVWQHPGWGRAGFELARTVLHSRVEGRELEVLDLSVDSVGTFDLVLFLGVLYHMRNPLLALERVASVTSRQLILETHVDLLRTHRPAVAFYPRDELKADASNWWGPNVAAVAGMLTAVGFTRVELVYLTSYGGRLARALNDVRRGRSPWSTWQQGRAVFHAFK